MCNAAYGARVEGARCSFLALGHLCFRTRLLYKRCMTQVSKKVQL